LETFHCRSSCAGTYNVTDAGYGRGENRVELGEGDFGIRLALSIVEPRLKARLPLRNATRGNGETPPS
jgi:hypothetical protein